MTWLSPCTRATSPRSSPPAPSTAGAAAGQRLVEALRDAGGLDAEGVAARLRATRSGLGE
jgi:hypothetical protein